MSTLFNTPRTYTDTSTDSRQRDQSGVIPYRFGDDGVEILLITNRSGKRWIVPKGKIEPDMTSSASAAKEAYEEAGVRGIVDAEMIGDFDAQKNNRECIVELFAMEVTVQLKRWPEMTFRKRRWASITEAISRVESDDLAACLERLAYSLMYRRSREASAA